MRLRGEITYWKTSFGDKSAAPLDSDDRLGLSYSDEWLFVDPDRQEEQGQLALIRAHCIEHPEGVLVDVYQELTKLSLDKAYTPGTFEAQQKFLHGLRDEANELSSELKIAQYQHPYDELLTALDEDEDVWLASVLPFHSLRFFQLSPERKEHYLSEAGDTLWYAAAVANEAGTTLSGAYFKFLASIEAGRLPEIIDHSGEAAIRQRFAKIMDFDLIQTVALTLGGRVKVELNRNIPGIRQEFTVEENPIGWLDALIYRELEPDGVAVEEKWDPAQPYNHLPDIELSIGKLVWFIAYTSHTILNTDFRTIMKANLQKNVLRSKHGTLLDKSNRTTADESPLTASLDPREPLHSE